MEYFAKLEFQKSSLYALALSHYMEDPLWCKDEHKLQIKACARLLLARFAIAEPREILTNG